MKKRILTFVLSALMVLQSTHIVFADVDDVPVPDRLKGETVVESTIAQEEYSSIFKILKYLDILTEEDGRLIPNALAERGFAAYAFARFVFDGDGNAEENIFSDVSSTYAYAAGVNSAYKLEIIDFGDGKFYPKNPIKYLDAAKMAIRVLGYDLKLNDAKVYTIAKKLNLHRGIDTSSSKMTNGELIVLLKNTIEAQTINIENIYISDGTPQISYTADGEQFINKKDIVLRTGIVTAQRHTSLFGDCDLATNEIEINRHSYKCLSDIDEDFFGKSVFAYVDTIKNVIVTMWEYPYEDAVTVISGNDLMEVNTENVVYTDNDGRNKRITLSSSAKVIFNNQYYGGVSSAVANNIFSNATNLILKNNDGDSDIDVIQVEKVTYAIVNSVSVISNRISLMYGKGVVDLSDADNGIDIIMGGLRIDASELQKDDILSVISSTKNNGQKNYKLTVSRDSVTGTFQQINQNDGRTFTVNDKEYPVSAEYADYVENGPIVTPQIGQEVKFLLSADGKIVSAETSDGYTYAYIMKLDLTAGLDKNMKIKVFTTGGSAETLTLSKKTKLITSAKPEGERLDAETIYNRITTAGSPNIDVVGYKKNSDGLISELCIEKDETASNPGTSSYPLNKYYEAGGTGPNNAAARLYAGILAAKYQLPNSMPIIAAPDASNRGNEQYYALLTHGMYSGDYYFADDTISLYNVDKFYSAGFAVVRGGNTINLDEYITPVMISKITEAINSRGENVKLVYYYNGEKEMSVELSDDIKILENTAANHWYGTNGVTVDDLVIGDVIQFKTDNSGAASHMRVLLKGDNIGTYRVQQKTTEGVQTPHLDVDKMEKIMIIYAKVEDINGRKAIVNVSPSGTDPARSYPVFITAVYAKNTFTVFDTAKNKVIPVTLDEIQPGDNIVIRKRWNESADVFIIR